MTTSLSGYSGNSLYLDTMIPYLFLRRIDDSTKKFFKRVEQGELLAYTSVLTFDELGYRLLLAFIKDRYGGSALERLRAEEEKMLGEFASTVSNLLQQLRAYTNLTILDILASDLDVMIQAMAQYRIRPRDALHYAAMQRVGCLDLASNDLHFDRIPAITRYAL